MKSKYLFVIALIGSSVFVSPVKTNALDISRSCPKWETKIRQHKLPVREFSYIMWRESKCEPKAIGWNYKRGYGVGNCKRTVASVYKKCYAVASYDSGLLQINSSWVTLTAEVCRSKWGDMTVLLNPECNLKVAAKLYFDGGGIRNWRGASSK